MMISGSGITVNCSSSDNVDSKKVAEADLEPRSSVSNYPASQASQLLYLGALLSHSPSN